MSWGGEKHVAGSSSNSSAKAQRRVSGWGAVVEGKGAVLDPRLWESGGTAPAGSRDSAESNSGTSPLLL